MILNKIVDCYIVKIFTFGRGDSCNFRFIELRKLFPLPVIGCTEPIAQHAISSIRNQPKFVFFKESKKIFILEKFIFLRQINFACILKFKIHHFEKSYQFQRIEFSLFRFVPLLQWMSSWQFTYGRKIQKQRIERKSRNSGIRQYVGIGMGANCIVER